MDFNKAVSFRNRPTPKNNMKPIKNAISALATSLLMLLMLVSVANAQDLKEGVRYKFTQGGAILYVKLSQLKDGMAYIETQTGKWLTATGAGEGAVVKGDGNKDAATKWKLVNNGNGWNFLNAANPANALCRDGVGPKGEGKSTGVLKLRRNNAGGAGNTDQLWKLEGEAK